jgi:hypothetical protein
MRLKDFFGSKPVRAVLAALFVLSACFNALTVSFVLSSRKSGAAVLSFGTGGNGYASGAAVVSVPEGSSAEFGLVSVSLYEGGAAFLQFSAVRDGVQTNFSNRFLFDGDIVSVEDAPFGAKITALKEGEALLQTFSNGGFLDIALVTVKKREERP